MSVSGKMCITSFAKCRDQVVGEVWVSGGRRCVGTRWLAKCGYQMVLIRWLAKVLCGYQAVGESVVCIRWKVVCRDKVVGDVWGSGCRCCLIIRRKAFCSDRF